MQFLDPLEVGVTMNPLRAAVKKYTAARLAAPFFLFLGGVAISMMSSNPAVLAPSFFLEKVAVALLFLAFVTLAGNVGVYVCRLHHPNYRHFSLLPTCYEVGPERW